MCGRYGFISSKEQLQEYFGLTDFPEFDIHYNIGPHTLQPVVCNNSEGERTAQLMQWGLVPSWSKDGKPRFSTINARAEDITTRTAFRDPIRTGRCLIPADVFYEWKREGKEKRPFRISLKSGEPLALAGVWDVWHSPERDLHSFSVITTEANEALLPIHNRMPVILHRSDFEAWLSSSPADPPLHLLRPIAGGELEVCPAESLSTTKQLEKPKPARQQISLEFGDTATR